MDLHIAARAPLDRWALVESLGLRPEAALDFECALARVLHPTGAEFALVVLVRDDADLSFLTRIQSLTAGRRRRTVLAIIDDRLRVSDVVAAGAQIVVQWDASTPFPDPSVLVSLERADDLVVLSEPAVAPA